MNALINFPQSAIIDATGNLSLEWFMWFQNPQFLTLTIGDALGVDSGGTGATTLTDHGVVIGNGTDSVSVTSPGAANTVLRGNGVLADPTFGSMVLASADFANQGTTTTVLHGNASGNPSFGAVSLTTDVSGTLPATRGGTGVSNNSASTITISGSFGLTLTIGGVTTLTLPASGTVTALGNSTTGSGAIVLETSPTLVTPVLGVATATSLSLAGFFRPATPAGIAQSACQLWAGSGAPSNTDGSNGDFYFRGDGSAGTFIYNKAAGTWTAFA